MVIVSWGTPLAMTALSVPLLRERVGPRRWAAVFVGFIGVLVIIGPTGQGFQTAVVTAVVVPVGADEFFIVPMMNFVYLF